MKNCTLVIMAAGIGSRYGKGIKQLEVVGPSGELIIDYSIYAAKRAGFNKVVFIIREDIEKEFREAIGDRIQDQIKVEYVFQDINNLPGGLHKPADRTKPWGTGQAVLACKGIVNEPFVVINADDYYGDMAFEKVYEFLCQAKDGLEKPEYCMVGFQLGNTLSENGSVTRGVCQVSENHQLVDVIETTGIHEEDGKIVSDLDNPLTHKELVSMNMWGFTPDIFEVLENKFIDFLQGLSSDDIKSEYLLPNIVDQLLKAGKCNVTVLTSSDRWFGVTYHEDKDFVVNSILQLIENDVYPKDLYK
ncbi:glutamate synthase [NADPH] large chain [Lachnospiraceae bacterium KM106-2]|nr:glutamate synthase [NADPH] large chain [Lachnospiraceae bacterium KM106-2]